MCLFLCLPQPVIYASCISNIVHMSCLVFLVQNLLLVLYFLYFHVLFLYFHVLFLYFIFHVLLYSFSYHDVLVQYLELYFTTLLTGYVAGVLDDTVPPYGPEPGILAEQDGPMT
ncbi:hypothetical protein M6B38_118390 [Iris pallida]|uniref:Uncharacterized protein n=1 Tax=Iris pallida TaxID=29817 RepID=A0AAX6HIP3_IRIPA|nr:hypothetical protein M6B38_118390 [Iris pallida]